MKVLSKDDLPKDLKAPRGKIEKVVGFTDKNGDNVVVFSRTSKASKGEDGVMESAYLEVLHVAGSAGGPSKVLRTVKDQVEKCDADLSVTFRDAALAVTDLDKDGFGELTFAYSLGCASDLSPATLKLLVLENGDKYILRGTTRVPKMGDDPASGGDYQVDASFKDGPPEFLTHAKSSWAKVRAH